MNGPHWVARRGQVPDAHLLEDAMATIRAAIPPSLLVLFALHLDAMKREHAIGHFAAEFHMHKGDVRSAAFNRRTTWQRMEPVDKQEPKP